MTKEMVNMAKVDTVQVAQETGVPTEHVEKVVKQLIVDKNNHKRQPKPAPPEGGISLSEAERRYGIPNPTISRWVRKGYIPVLLRTNKELYIDETVIAKLAKAYQENPGQGKRTIKQNFNPS